MSLQDIKAYIDGELSAEERAEFERDLATNPALATQLSETRALSAAIKNVKSPASTGFESTLFALARAPKAPWYVRKPGYAYGLAAACIAIIAFASIPVTRQEQASFETAAWVTKSQPLAAESAPSAPAESKQSQIEGRQSYADAGGTEGQTSLQDMPSHSLDYPAKRRQRVDAYAKAESPQSIGGLFIDRTGNVSVNVANLNRAIEAAKTKTKKFGGFIAGSSITNEKEFSSGQLTIKVPERSYDQMVAAVKGLGEVTQESSSTDDLTTQVVDNDARLKAKKNEEAQYLAIMKQAKNVKEVLQVREQLARVQEEIESMTATLKSLRARASMSTIELILTQRSTGGKKTLQGNWAEDAKNEAIASAMLKLKKVGSGLIWVGVYSPVWIPILIGGWFVWRRSRKGIL